MATDLAWWRRMVDETAAIRKALTRLRAEAEQDPAAWANGTAAGLELAWRALQDGHVLAVRSQDGAWPTSEQLAFVEDSFPARCYERRRVERPEIKAVLLYLGVAEACGGCGEPIETLAVKSGSHDRCFACLFQEGELIPEGFIERIPQPPPKPAMAGRGGR